MSSKQTLYDAFKKAVNGKSDDAQWASYNFVSYLDWHKKYIHALMTWSEIGIAPSHHEGSEITEAEAEAASVVIQKLVKYTQKKHHEHYDKLVEFLKTEVPLDGIAIYNDTEFDTLEWEFTDREVNLRYKPKEGATCSVDTKNVTYEYSNLNDDAE